MYASARPRSYPLSTLIASAYPQPKEYSAFRKGAKPTKNVCPLATTTQFHQK
jgi:hypothetical protein